MGTEESCCVAYGLGIQSDLPLPELLREKAEVNVHVRLGAIDCDRLEDTSTSWSSITANDGHLFLKDVGTFHVRGGSEIIVDPTGGISESLLRLFILGPALAVLLHQRGHLVIHSSAVSIDGQAVGFLGGPGWGKSTMAAALYARGHSLVADDVVALDLDDPGRPAVSPGFPQFKLWPDAAAMLQISSESLPPLHHRTDKRGCQARRGFSTGPSRFDASTFSPKALARSSRISTRRTPSWN